MTQINYKIGDKVQRLENMSHPVNHEWVEECKKRNLDPTQFFTVKGFTSDIGVSLKEMPEVSWFKSLFSLSQTKEVKEI